MLFIWTKLSINHSYHNFVTWLLGNRSVGEFPPTYLRRLDCDDSHHTVNMRGFNVFKHINFKLNEHTCLKYEYHCSEGGKNYVLG